MNDTADGVIVAGNNRIASQRTKIVTEDHSPCQAILDTGKYEQVYRVATIMAQSSLLPKHLAAANLDTARANCFRIINQALRWGLDPFSVIDHTYVVAGKLAYEGKLVAAVINGKAKLQGRLRFEFSGNGENRTVKAIGRFQGEDVDRDVDVELKSAKTGNDMWKKDPDQKLVYNASIKWARRHCPELLLGVATDDDLERIAEQATGAIESLPTVRATDLLHEAPRIVEQPQEQKTEGKTKKQAEHDPSKQEEPASNPNGVGLFHDSPAAEVFATRIVNASTQEHCIQLRTQIGQAFQDKELIAEEARQLQDQLAEKRKHL